MSEPTTERKWTEAGGVIGRLMGFDRMVFRGHLQGLARPEQMAAFLNKERVLLKEFKEYVDSASAAMKTAAVSTAELGGRPYIYLEDACTARSGRSKEEIVREIVERDGVKEGLICVLGALELCRTFSVKRVAEGRLGVVRRSTKCLHFYYYFMDPEFGQMYIRVQSWFPFQTQVYVNGREWLARALQREAISVRTQDNCILEAGDLKRAQELAEKLPRKDWPAFLGRLAERINPWLAHVKCQGFGEYYWVVHQLEVATDVLFKSRAALEELMPTLFDHAIREFAADDVMRFLGRTRIGACRGEVTTSLNKRKEGRRIKHWMRGNSIKMYDKGSALRIETTINKPRDFRILKHVEEDGKPTWRWVPMGKGVANAWRYLQVGQLANQRYLDALSCARPNGKAVEALDSLCRGKTVDGRHVARIEPVSKETAALFVAVMAGEHHIRGFRNKDIAARLFPAPHEDIERRRVCARTSRMLAKIRGHGLIARMPHTHRYRITSRGALLMTAAVRIRQVDFPALAAA
jgi:hypothetical protein